MQALALEQVPHHVVAGNRQPMVLALPVFPRTLVVAGDIFHQAAMSFVQEPR